MTNEIPKRPIWNDEIRKEFAKVIGKDVNEWCNDETPLEECIESAENVLQFHSDDDGYEMAKEFEDEGFYPDAQLVEILEFASYKKHEIKEKFVKKWVTENNLKLDMEVGSKVVVNTSQHGKVECEIVKLYPETLQYGVWHEKMGRKKEDGHLIVNSENIIR